MSEFTMREVGLDDLDQIMVLVNACDIADTGNTDLTRADVEAALSESEDRGFALIDGRGVHHALVWIERQSTRSAQSGEYFVHPDADPSIASPLIDALLTAQREDPAGRALRVFVSANAPAKSAILVARGATIVRRFYKMTIDLGSRTDEATWPDDAEVCTVTSSDEDLRAVHAVVNEAFRDHWEHVDTTFEEWVGGRRARDDFDPTLWSLVRIDGEPAAALLGADSEGQGFIPTLGVRRSFRSRGLARSLLLQAFSEFRRRGLPRASLFVDSANATGAVRLYESVGMHVLSQWDSHEFPAVSARTADLHPQDR
jgi:ribosomal protein S18 acetylase RimI-like enzyme